MTKTEAADLALAIDLLGQLREDMNHGFERMTEAQQQTSNRVTVIETQLAAREALAARSTQRFRWAVGIAITALVSVALFAGKELAPILLHNF